MSDKKVKTIPIAKRRKIADLQQIRNEFTTHKNKLCNITEREDYKQTLEDISKYIPDLKTKRISEENFKDILVLKENLDKAMIGDMLRKDIVEQIETITRKINQQINKEACNVVEEYLEGAQTREEIIKKVADLILSISE